MRPFSVYLANGSLWTAFRRITVHWADWVGIILAVALVVRGFRQGLIVQLTAFVAIGLGLLGGLYLQDAALPFLPDLGPAEVQFAVSFAVVFAAVALCVNVVGRLLQKVARVLFLGGVDRILGALFGLLVAVQAMLVIMLLVTRYFPSGIDWVHETSLAPGLFALLERILPLLPAHFGEFFESHYRDLLS